MKATRAITLPADPSRNELLMLSRFFHRWEHHLASVTKDRVVRPFEWGLDWIPPNGRGDAPPGPGVHRWIDEVMRDTGAFFDIPPTRAYQFDFGKGN